MSVAVVRPVCVPSCERSCRASRISSARMVVISAIDSQITTVPALQTSEPGHEGVQTHGPSTPCFRAGVVRRRYERRRPNCLLSTLLHIIPNEVLRVLLQDFVNLVQQFIQIGLDLFTLLGLGRSGLFDFFLLSLSWLALLLLSLWHDYLPRTLTTRAQLGVLRESRNPPTTYRHVPLFL